MICNHECILSVSVSSCFPLEYSAKEKEEQDLETLLLVPSPHAFADPDNLARALLLCAAFAWVALIPQNIAHLCYV